MTKEWWRVQLKLNKILKHNKFATSPAFAGVIRYQTSVSLVSVYFINNFHVLIEKKVNGNQIRLA